MKKGENMKSVVEGTQHEKLVKEGTKMLTNLEGSFLLHHMYIMCMCRLAENVILDTSQPAL